MKKFIKFKDVIEWWLQGLAFFCPAFLKHLMGLSPDKITIEFHEEQVMIKHFSVDSGAPLDIQSFVKTDDVQRLSVLQWLHKRREKNAKVVLLVAEKILLRKTLSFPSAAQSNLKEVLEFELSRRTPFSQEQAYYDHQIIDHDKQGNKLKIELFVVPKQKIDPILALLNEWNIAIDVLKPVVTHPDAIEINLLPIAQRNNTNNRSDYVTLALATGVFSLFLAVLYAPLTQQEQQLEFLEKEVKINRKAAIELQKIKDEKQRIIEQTYFLENKQKNTLTGIELLNEVTKITPNDTWLTRVVMKNNELQLQGESSSASSLIQIIESSERFTQVQFKSPVTQNNTSGKDKFHLSAKLVIDPMIEVAGEEDR